MLLGYVFTRLYLCYFKVYSLYLLKTEFIVKQPQAGPSGGIQKEGIVIIGDDGSMWVTAPEDLPVGLDVEVEGSDVDDPDPAQVQANVCVCVFVFNKKV